VAVVVLPQTAITIVIGELVPKLFALRNKEWVCLSLSPTMKWFARSVWPVVWVLESSASQLMKLANKAADSITSLTEERTTQTDQ